MKRKGLTRAAVVTRALEIGGAEGLEAVSLRRLAQELKVTPMALYRHVKDKQDLINAMTEAVLEGLDIKAGIKPSMSWTEQARRALLNFRDQMKARPLALPLSIAYTGEGPPAFWRINEALLGILVGAGFTRREAAILIRVLSNLVSGYLYLMTPSGPDAPVIPGPAELELLRKRFELAQLSLPPDEFPNSIASAREVADVWLRDPDLWWRDTADLLIAGLEGLLERKEARRGNARQAR